MPRTALDRLCSRHLLALASITLLCGCAEPPPPNIIFVFTDDHATAAIGAYGGRLAGLNPTPTIDRLAREGMRFRNAFVTNAICAPSRAVILTGRHSHLNGIRTNAERFDSSQVTFPGLLRAAGYQTALVGKWHLKSDPVGFDSWEILPGQGQYFNPDFVTPEGTARDTGYVTDLITDKVLDWLANRRDPSRPFLLMYQHKAPHREWSPDLPYLDRYDDVEIPEPPTLFDDWIGRTSAAATQEMTIARHMTLGYDLRFWPNTIEPDDPANGWAERLRERMTPGQLAAYDSAYGPRNAALRDARMSADLLVRWKYQRYLKDYLRTIASVDDNLERLLNYLDASGLASNTVVVYSSDQGFYLGEHGWFDKRWMYEESLRMPLIVRWPGVVPAGSVDDHLVQNLDFAATFLEMAGVAIPRDMQGRSLVPLLRGPAPTEWRDAIYYHYYEYPGVHAVQRHDGVRTDRYKLMHYYLIDEWELFDLEADPDELHSVHADPAYAAVRVELEQRLFDLRAQYGVPASDFATVADTTSR
ncbi:MAG: sulfatase [Gemmatimonadota bacterium]|nr:sulfatase [Gemmatimonadota bacterium]